MRLIGVGLLSGLALAGCGNPQTSGIVAIGPDTYAVETRGRALATAVERGLTEATSFCTAQSRQTELLGTRINADSYQVAFRCTGGTGLAGATPFIGRVPAGVATRNSSLGPIPVVSSGRPVITGQAFAAAPPPPQGFDLGTVGALQGRPATVAGNPFASAPAPTRQPSFLPPVSSLTAPAPAPVFQAPPAASPAALAPPPVTSPFQPLQSPLAAPGAAPAFAPPAAPASAPAGAPAFAPLTSPLAAPAPAPAGAASFQPLAAPAASAPPAFQPLASPAGGAQPLPGASRPLSALPPVASPARGGSSVPPVSAGAPLGEAPSVVPPPAFWNTPR